MIASSGTIFEYQQVKNYQPKEFSKGDESAHASVGAKVWVGKKSHGLNRYLNGIFIGSIVGLFLLLSPLLYIEARYRAARSGNPDPDQQIQQQVASSMEKVSPTPRTIVSSYNVALTPTPPPSVPADYGKILNESYMSILNPVDSQFSVIIPKIGVNSRVIANVNAGNEEEYREALKHGVAHAKGTYLPGERGTTYVFAHSTDYVWNITRFNAVFYLLREMEEEDQIYIVHNNKVYPYQVADVRIVEPDETYYLKPKQGSDELILQTCWPPGTTHKRLLVFAEPGGQISEVEEELSYSP